MTDAQDSLANKLISILSLDSKEDRKIAFRFLSSSQRALLWKNYLSRCVIEEGYTKEQKLLIEESFTFLVPAFFENEIIQASDSFEIWKFKIAKNFSDRLKTATFNDLLDINSLRKIILVPDGTGSAISRSIPVDCSCNTSGDFCANNNYNIGPTCVVTHKCNTGGCTAKEDGCGWFWSQKCEGKCKETYTGNCP